MDRPCHPPLLPFFPFYFCNRFQGGHTRTVCSALGAALCIGTFSVSLLKSIVALLAAMEGRARAAGEVPSVSPRSLL